jgi:hypothetical protein
MPTYSLHLNGKALATVVPDEKHSGMWRIKWPDGSTSDMVNLARAKDAALTLCAAKLSLKKLTGFRWTKVDN